jgi:hypothetical protein
LVQLLAKPADKALLQSAHQVKEPLEFKNKNMIYKTKRDLISLWIDFNK